MKAKTVLAFFLFVPLLSLAEGDLTALLQKPVVFFSQDGEPLKAVLQSLGRTHGLSIVADDDVEGTVTVEMNNTTVKGVMEAILRPGGFYYQIEDGWISVARFRTVLYAFDYPQISRSGSSSSSISLGGQNTGNGQGGMNFTGVGASGLSQALNGGSGTTGNDTTQISISQKMEADFWQSVETQIRSMLGKDETFVINKFSGIVQVKAGARTHRDLERFVAEVNDRIGAQVEIVAKIVEVSLTNENKLGIDWQAAAFSIGRDVQAGGRVIPPGETTAIEGLQGRTNVTKTGSFAFSADTFAGTVGSGKVDVVIRALEQQGDVKVTSQPRLRLLNNSTGYIKDATDRPFFRLNSNVTINAGGTTLGGTQPITQNQYSTQIVSIGTVLPVTAQISADDEVTLDVTPALSRLQDIVYSPDGQQTAPVLDVKQTSTIVRVKSGETAIIGGLITDSSSSTRRAVPFLGKMPLLGWAFRSDGKATQRTELVIFLTPTVLHKPSRLAGNASNPPAQQRIAAVEGIPVP
jgi:MSHA type pilus biogenesis protein MshL